MEIMNGFNDSGTEVIKIICKLGWAKAREGDWGLLPNLDVAKQKFKELRKLTQKDGKPKGSEARRAVKEVMAAKGTDGEDELSDDDDLKDPAPTSKGSKNRPGFIKSAIPMWFSSHIQAQFTNLISIGKLLPFTPSQSRLTILSYQDSTTLVSMLKCKNTDIVQSEPKCHATEVFKKDKVISDLKIQFAGKQNELTAIKKKAEKTEQKIEYHSKFWSEKTIRYFAEIHNLKNKIKRMQELHNDNKIRITMKDIIEDLICLNCSSLIVLANILKFINNSKSVTDFVNFFNHICKNINIIYQLTTQFLLPCHEEENWVPSNDSADIEMMISACYEASNTFLWSFKAKTDITAFFDKDIITEKDEDLEKKNEEVNFEVLNK